MLFNQLRRAVAWPLLLAATAAPLDAQRLLDLPVRAWAGADAVVTGAAATFWNPASTALLTGRGEVILFDVLAPEPTGLGGFAAAAALRLDERTTLALGYHHVGIDGILHTTDSPLADEAAPLDLGEDAIALAVGRNVGAGLHAGVVARYVRAAEFAVDRSIIEFGAGVDVRPELPARPVIGVAARAESDGIAWIAGVQATPVVTSDGMWTVGGSWGAEGGPLQIGTSHRLATHGTWSDRVAVSLGVSNEPDAAGRTWRPLASATLRFSRYSLGVLREEMANDFGAVHAFRFSVAF